MSSLNKPKIKDKNGTNINIGNIVVDYTDDKNSWALYKITKIEEFGGGCTDCWLKLYRKSGEEFLDDGWQLNSSLVKIPSKLRNAPIEVIKLYLAMQGVEFQ